MILVGWALVGCGSSVQTPVGATLDDGQVLVGGITTPVLRLAGAFGDVAVPLEDVGMVVPVEGLTLGESHGQVDLWLRNGSELRGRWDAPELAMAIAVGGRQVEVELPTDRMQTLQLQATPAWPSFDVFRVKTTWGDDFVVDAEQTRLGVKSALGEFEVTLAECSSVGPVGEPTGDWRFVLNTGTVLIGAPRESELAFALPMGPERIVVPLTALVSLQRGGWAPPPVPAVVEPMAAAPEEAVDGSGLASEVGRRARPGLSSSAGWFDNAQMEDAKR